MNAARKHTDHANPTDEALTDAVAISCLLDGELDDAASEHALARLLSDTEAQLQWEIMHAIGDALRSSEVAAQHRAGFVMRCRARLSSEPTIIATRWANDRRKLVRRVVLPGAAVAAAAVMLAVVAVPQLRGGGDRTPVVANEPVMAPIVTRVTGPTIATSATSRPIAPYLQAHREIAPSGVLPARAPYLRTSAAVPSEGSQ